MICRTVGELMGSYAAPSPSKPAGIPVRDGRVLGVNYRCEHTLATRSYRVIDDITVESPPNRAFDAITWRGSLLMQYSVYEPAPGGVHRLTVPVDKLDGAWAEDGGPFDYPTWRTLGFAGWHRPGDHGVIIPMWAFVGLFAVAALFVISVRLSGRNLPNQRCSSCGYDLRATPERCPECGPDFTRGTQAAA